MNSSQWLPLVLFTDLIVIMMIYNKHNQTYTEIDSCDLEFKLPSAVHRIQQGTADTTDSVLADYKSPTSLW